MMMRNVTAVICILVIIFGVMGCDNNSSIDELNSPITMSNEPKNETIVLDNSSVLKLQSVVVGEGDYETYKKIEMDVAISGFTGNPFDPNELDLSATFVSSTGKVMVVPGYYNQEYSHELIPYVDTAASDIGKVWGWDPTHNNIFFPIEGKEKGRIIGAKIPGMDSPVARVVFDNTKGDYEQLSSSIIVPSIEGFTHLRYWMKGDGSGNEAELVLSGGKNESVIPVVLSDNEWTAIDIPLSELKSYDGSGFNIESARSIRIRPVSLSRMEFFLEDVQLYNTQTGASAVIVDFNLVEVTTLEGGEIQGIERVEPKGAPGWKIRFAPPESGDWSYTVQIAANGNKIARWHGQLQVADSDHPGLVRIEPTKKRNFVFDNGDAYIPIGQNVAWWTTPTRGTFDYDIWFNRMGEAGANYARVWMASWGTGLFWQDTGTEDYTNRLNRAFLLDHIVEQAETHGIYLQLAFLHHGPFSTIHVPQWFDNPFNVDNGGYLDSPDLFFTDAYAKDQFKKYMRYIVARWGYSTSIMSWELFNEVNWTDDYDGNISNAWHQEMAEYLKQIDPYRHLVSSSSGKIYDPLLEVEELDFINLHGYGLRHYGEDFPKFQKNFYEKYEKPVLFSEMGIGHSGEGTRNGDPEGIHLHQGIWSGVMGAGAGTGMNWWWFDYMHSLDLYHYFTPISKFMKLADWDEHDLSQLEIVDMNEMNSSDSTVAYEGYKTTRSAYLWMYEKNYSHTMRTPKSYSDVKFDLPLEDGSYLVRWFDTYRGEVINEVEGQAAGGVITVQSPTWSKDIAVIIERTDAVN